MPKATIASMAVNPKKSLDSATKRQLQYMIDNEFMRKSTQFNAARNEQTRKLMEKYQKNVGFDKLRALVIKKREEYNSAEQALSSVGLDEIGNLRYMGDDERKKYPEQYKKQEELRKAIDQLSNEDIHSLQNKIIARLWCSSTIGEAIVIVNEVMGNGIIPTLQQSDVQAITMQ